MKKSVVFLLLLVLSVTLCACAYEEDRMGEIVKNAVIEHYAPAGEGKVATAASDVLGAFTFGTRTTIYANVLFSEYDDCLTDGRGFYGPVVVTVDNDKVTDYWEPEDGVRYADSIKEKFPFWMWSEALEQQSTSSLREECERQAREYFTDSVE